MAAPTTRDPMREVVRDNDALRQLLERWRSSLESLGARLPESAAAIRANIHLKQQVLYPAVMRADPQRERTVDAILDQDRLIEAWLVEAEEDVHAPNFADSASAAAAEADRLLLEENRDILPVLRRRLTATEQEQLLEDYRAVRDRAAAGTVHH